MARWLKQSTSVSVPIGPFLDSVDGNTVEGALTITQPDIRLKKNGGDWAQKAAAQTLTHEENGYYEVLLDATDTNTLGLMRLAVHETGSLPVWEDFLVVPANVWDSIFGADLLQVEAAAAAGTAPADIAAGVATKVIETQGSYTIQQALSVMLAALAGVTSNGGATLATPNGVTTRIVATIDGNNNRTAMTLTPSA